MPAVSGSPTQIATSADTRAELSGDPVDQFKNGDVGWVQSELGSPHGPYYALVKVGGPAVNGLTVLDVFAQPTMRWVSWSLLLPGGASALQTEYQPVTANGQTLFTLAVAPTGDVVMQINGVTYPEGVSWTRVGVNITWLNVPFVLAGPVPGPADVVTFIY